ncbi:MAG: glycosyltransferase, partial [Candidatus Aenigmarchaeota archaeon]|nr:glycosyltransferase [Candidatus Aenigmarchaeota archaeon]
MKIMIVSDLAYPHIGGAESYVINLGSRLAKRGHEVYLLTSKIKESPMEEEYE